MALVYKIGLYTSNNEIVIVDNTGYYSSSNTTGWNNNSTAFIQSLGVTNITDISITIDTNTVISIDSTTNTAILAGGSINNLLTPESLIFTLNKSTYSQFYTDLGEFSDGTHTISVTLTMVGGATHTATNTFFVYKTIEEEIWDMFHKVATQYYIKRDMDEYLRKALTAFSLLKGLEYTCRTALSAADFSQAQTQLEALQDMMDYIDLNYK